MHFILNLSRILRGHLDGTSVHFALLRSLSLMELSGRDSCRESQTVQVKEHDRVKKRRPLTLNKVTFQEMQKRGKDFGGKNIQLEQLVLRGYSFIR